MLVFELVYIISKYYILKILKKNCENTVDKILLVYNIGPDSKCDV